VDVGSVNLVNFGLLFWGAKLSTAQTFFVVARPHLAALGVLVRSKFKGFWCTLVWGSYDTMR